MPSTAIPTLRYHDAPAAIDFLCDAFGFERHLVVDDGAGGIAHCQLTLGEGMVMLGSVREDRTFDQLISTVREVGAPTACPFLVLADVAGAADRVVAAGGEVVDPVADQDHGGQAFTCRDPEGNLWNVGSYDPWAPTP